MKIFLVSLIATLSLSASAQSLKLKPGLWSLELYTLENGKRVNAMDIINKQLAGLPKEQRDAVLKAMGPTDSSSTKQCITAEMLSNPDKFSSKVALKGCQTRPGKFTATQYTSTIKCNDGREMDIEINASSETSFISKSSLKANGVTQGSEVVGTFVSGKCN